jgi:hypothetical protein
MFVGVDFGKGQLADSDVDIHGNVGRDIFLAKSEIRLPALSLLGLALDKP